MGKPRNFYLSDENADRLSQVENPSALINSLLKKYFGDDLSLEELEKQKVELLKDQETINKRLAKVEKELKAFSNTTKRGVVIRKV